MRNERPKIDVVAIGVAVLIAFNGWVGIEVVALGKQVSGLAVRVEIIAGNHNPTSTK